MFEGIDAFRDHWYWAHLSAMGEESFLYSYSIARKLPCPILEGVAF